MPVGRPALVEELVSVEPVTSLAGRVPDPAPESLGGAQPQTAVASVHLEGVRKVFGETEAVAGIDLEISDGEFFSMLGPSGSGKTTTLRMIAGFDQPTSGRILLHGRDVTGVPPFDRDVNTVFQDYALFPHMNVAQNVAYGLRVRRVPKPERARRVAEALATVRLDDFGSRRPPPHIGCDRQTLGTGRCVCVRT